MKSASITSDYNSSELKGVEAFRKHGVVQNEDSFERAGNLYYNNSAIIFLDVAVLVYCPPALIYVCVCLYVHMYV